MKPNQPRALNCVSLAELQRRWSAVRQRMSEQAIDALVIQNSSDWVGGYVRWFSNQPATNGYPTSLVFPLEGGMSLVEQGPFGGIRQSSEIELRSTGIARRLTTPSYPSVGYSGGYDADIVGAELGTLGAKRVGLVAPASMYHSFGRRLTNNLLAAEVVDATDLVDQIKAVKSAEELHLVSRVAAMQDEVMDRVRQFIRPGLKDFEIAAFAQYVGQQLGSEQGIFLCSSAPPGEAASFRPRSLQGRTLQRGDTFSLLIENNGAGGFYTELSRMFVLGMVTKELGDAHLAVLDAQRFALSLLKPGTACKDIYSKHNAYLGQRNLAPERRLSMHGMGYDMVERPLIRDDETMQLAQGMVIVCHPGILNDRMFVHNTEAYVIGPNGPSDSLHWTPKTIFELS